jgi:hypothetical protein
MSLVLRSASQPGCGWLARYRQDVLETEECSEPSKMRIEYDWACHWQKFLSANKFPFTTPIPAGQIPLKLLKQMKKEYLINL